MNGTNLVLDTNILIYYSNGNKVAYELITNNHIFISVITEMEMLSFAHHTEKEHEKIKKLLSLFTTIPFNSIIQKEAILLRRKYNIKLPDAIIAATSIYLSCAIATADKEILQIKEISTLEFKDI